MIRHPHLLLLVLTLLPVSSFSEEPIDPKEAEIEALVRESPKLHSTKLLEYNLRKLEAVYEVALRKAEDPEHRKAIRNSQKAWQTFFEADGAAASWNAKGGSYAYPAQMEQKIYQVRSRMFQLTTPFLEGWPRVPSVANPMAAE